MNSFIGFVSKLFQPILNLLHFEFKKTQKNVVFIFTPILGLASLIFEKLKCDFASQFYACELHQDLKMFDSFFADTPSDGQVVPPRMF